MKKLLSLLALLPMAMNAQLLTNQDFGFQRAPYLLKSMPNKMMAPARADLTENQMILGHYDTDEVITGGYLGLTNFPGVIPTAIELTPEELKAFQGGKIVAFRVGLSTATPVTRVFAAPSTSQGLGTFTEWSCNSGNAGWNVIPVDPPYEINLGEDDGLFIGFDYQQTSSNYPISAVMAGDINPTFVYITYQGNTSWFDVGLESYGNLSLQCIVESDYFPQYLIKAMNLHTTKYVKVGENIPFTFTIKNGGTATNIPAGACSYDVFIDGEQVATLSNTEAFGRNYLQISDAIASTGVAVGPHTLTITINALNGEPLEEPITMSDTFTIYEFGFPRQMHLIEQFTSTYCTHCPKGNALLTLLTSMRDDVAWVGIHGNMSGTDPMRTLQCDSIMSYQGSDYYPSVSLDRSTGLESDTEIITGLGYDPSVHQEVANDFSNFLDYVEEAPSFATVNINSTIDATTRVATITINGQLTPDFDQMLGADSKLTVYITEDGVTARQLNNGRWENNYVHNGVMRKALHSVLGNNLNRTGNTYKNEFTYTIPSGWNIDKLNVVAFISRPLINGAHGIYTDLFVNQANKRKLGEYDEPEILRGDVNNDGEIDIADVTSLINHVLSKNYTESDHFNPANADVNFDGDWNIADVTMLINFVLSRNWSD